MQASNTVVEKGKKDSHTSCSDLSQPKPNGVLDLSFQNCICCAENKKEQFVTFKINTSCSNHKEMCKALKYFDITDYPAIVHPSALTITQDPAFDPPLPPGLPCAYPPEVIDNPRSVVGKRVLVIGGSRGIGKAIAERFHNEGACVIATSRYPECYEKTPYPLKKLDIRLEKSVKKFFKKVTKKNSKIDILVIVAGVYWDGPLLQATGDDILGLLNLKVAGYQRCVHYALPHMLHSDDTRVISFSSVASYVSAVNNTSVYSMANIAQERWNDSLQEEMMFSKAQGIRTYGPTFSLVQPVFITTDIGLFEYFNASSLKKNSFPIEAALLSSVGNQNLGGGILTGGPNTVPYPSPTADEAVFRIAIASQPGVRYSVPDANDEFINGVPYLLFLQYLNTLAPTDLVNLMVSSSAVGTNSPEYLEESRQRAIEVFCEN